MATLEQGRAKWERKTQNAGSKWKDGVSGKEGALAEGLSAAGLPPGPQFLQAWSSGVGAVSAQDFQSSIAGKGQKWADNTRAGISR